MLSNAEAKATVRSRCTGDVSSKILARYVCQLRCLYWREDDRHAKPWQAMCKQTFFVVVMNEMGHYARLGGSHGRKPTFRSACLAATSSLHLVAGDQQYDQPAHIN